MRSNVNYTSATQRGRAGGHPGSGSRIPRPYSQTVNALLAAASAERFAVPSRSFPPHSHDEFVISLNAASVLRERVRLDRDRFDVGSGVVTTYNPHQVQASVSETVDDRPWEGISIHVSPAQIVALAGIGDFEFSRPVVDDARIAAGLAKTASTTGATAEEWAQWTIAECIAAAPARKQRVESPSSTVVNEARRVLMADLSRPIRLADLATVLGISADALARAFVRETGVPPYAWHLQARLREGRRRLRSGVKIAEAAAELGFTDQAHFHRHYRAAYARTPREDLGVR